MKKSFLLVGFVALTLSSCGLGTTGSTTSTSTSTGTSAAASAGTSLLNGLLGALTSNITTVSEANLYGTWTYTAPECKFESADFLAQAGGEVIATEVEKKLDTYLGKVGITKGVTSFTFNNDEQKTFSIAGKNGTTICTGTYTFDASSKQLVLNGFLGLVTVPCTVGTSGTDLCLLFDADKILALVNKVGAAVGKQSSTVSSITNLLGSSYSGMKLGFSLSK